MFRFQKLNSFSRLINSFKFCKNIKYHLSPFLDKKTRFKQSLLYTNTRNTLSIFPRSNRRQVTHRKSSLANVALVIMSRLIPQVKEKNHTCHATAMATAKYVVLIPSSFRRKLFSRVYFVVEGVSPNIPLRNVEMDVYNSSPLRF